MKHQVTKFIMLTIKIFLILMFQEQHITIQPNTIPIFISFQVSGLYTLTVLHPIPLLEVAQLDTSLKTFLVHHKHLWQVSNVEVYIHITLHVYWSSYYSLFCTVHYYLCSAFFRDNCTEGDVRISEVYSVHESTTGLPEICTNSSWNKIRGSNISNSIANVMCKQLGFTRGETSPPLFSCIICYTILMLIL